MSVVEVGEKPVVWAIRRYRRVVRELREALEKGDIVVDGYRVRVRVNERAVRALLKLLAQLMFDYEATRAAIDLGGF